MEAVATLRARAGRTGAAGQTAIVAVYDDAQGSIGEYLIGMRTFGDNFTTRLDAFVAVKLAPGADRAAVAASIDGAVAAFPNYAALLLKWDLTEGDVNRAGRPAG